MNYHDAHQQHSISLSSSPSPSIVIENPDDLLSDKSLFVKLLQRQYDGLESLQIRSLIFRPLPHDSYAILSQVLEIHVVYGTNGDYDNESIDDDYIKYNNIPKIWVAKFLKDSLPLEEMFRVEGYFYRNFAKDIKPLMHERTPPSSSPLSVSVPNALYCGPKCIILEKILDLNSYNLLQSCPKDLIEITVRAMAEIHAKFWNYRTDEVIGGLSSKAGMGSAMSGIEKERCFPKLCDQFCTQFLDATTYGPGNHSATQDALLPRQLQSLCCALSKRRLRDVHNLVHNNKPTLIHGDWHVGNLLFTRSDHDDDKTVPTTVWVLDWATSGIGNPLIDFVFFFIVSTQGTCMKEIWNLWLPYYYKILTSGSTKVATELSWSKCQFMFRTCLLNQFILLVCYDEVSKSLLASHANTSKTRSYFTKHFENVNRRCVEALFSKEMNMVSYPLPPIKTEIEVQEERMCCTKEKILQKSKLINDI